MERSENESGFALISALFLAMATGGIVMLLSMTSMRTHQDAQHRLRSLQAQYLAEGSIEVAKQAIQDAIAAGGVPAAMGVATIDGVQVPYTVNPVGGPMVLTDAAGVQTTVQTYQAVGTAVVEAIPRTARRLVNAEWTPLFQYAVFFEQSLDILPAPDMVITGRIHTNGDLRLGCNTATLTLDTNHIRAVGTLRRWKKHNNTATVGNVLIRKWVANPFNGGEPVVHEALESLSQMTSLGIPSTTGYDSLFAGYDDNGDGDYDPGDGDWLPFAAGVVNRYGPPSGYPDSGHSLLLGAHGVHRITPPAIGSIAMYEADPAGDHVLDGSGEYIQVTPGTGTHRKGSFHESADLAIIVSADGSSWSGHDALGTDVTAALAGVVTIDQTYDKRQGGYVRVAKVDIAALNASVAVPTNGLVYVSHYGMGTGTDSKGVHLVNGADVGAKLTVVTEGSAYIQGDYNTTAPVSSAVIADAVNLLSNSWVNGTSKPTATDTTYNVALIVGNTETEDGEYNGGLENYPRFHENWTGITCTVIGSMISSWTNLYATGSVSDAQFNPPIRNYAYDVRFNDVTELPPFTPMSATVVDVARW